MAGPVNGGDIAMPCVPTFSVQPHVEAGFVILASWPKGHVEQLVGVFGTQGEAEIWVDRHSADFINQLGPPSKRVIDLDSRRRQ